MAENYYRFTALVIDVAGKVLRDVLENYFKNSGISEFGQFLDANIHTLLHVWKPEITCCDSRCPHLVRRSKALLSNQQWHQLFKQKDHEHSRRFKFCPCQFTGTKAKLEDLDVTTASQIFQITSTNLSSSIINSLTELRIHRNNLVHVKSSVIEGTKFIQDWRSVEHAVLTLAGTISRHYQQKIQESIERIYKKQFEVSSPFGSEESISELSSDFTSSYDTALASTVSSPPPSADVMYFGEKLQDIHKVLDDIKSDISFLKRGSRVPHKYTGFELEKAETTGDREQMFAEFKSLESRFNENIISISAKLDEQYGGISDKIDKVVENVSDLKEKSHLQNEKFLSMDEDIDKIHSKLEMLENQNVGIHKKLDDITNISKSKHLLRYEAENSEPVSVHNIRQMKDLRMPVVGQSERTLLPRDQTSSLPIPLTFQAENREDMLPGMHDSAKESSLNESDKSETNAYSLPSTEEDSGKSVSLRKRKVHSSLNSLTSLETIDSPSAESSIVSPREDRSEPVLLRVIKKSIGGASLATSDYGSIDSEQFDRSTSQMNEQFLQSEAVKLEDNEELLSTRSEYSEHQAGDLQETSLRQSSIEVDGGGESNLIDKVLDEFERSGKLQFEPNSETENEDIEKIAGRTSYRVSSSSGGSIVTQDIDEEVCSHYLGIAGLPHDAGLLKIVERALKVQSGEPCRSTGIDTVLCLDASASMKGKAFEQLKSVALYITEYIENTAISRGLEENLAVVVVGHDTKIAQGLTNDYAKIKRAIQETSAEGTSPMLTGLLLSYIAIDQGGGATSILGHIVNPRIVLLTDGRPTDDSFINRWETEFQKKDPQILEKNFATCTSHLPETKEEIYILRVSVREKITEMANRLHSKGYPIYCIAIGQSSNKDFLHDIAVESDAMMFDMDDTEFIPKYFQYQNIVGKVNARLSDLDNSEECEIILADEIEKNAPDFTEKDKDYIREILKSTGILENEEFTGLPPLGSRICDLSENENGKILGTVIKHMRKDQIEIMWDDQHEEVRYYYPDGENDVKVIDSPVVLESDELIRVGVQVVRGPAWKNEYGNQDGGKGSLGMVYMVTNTGIVRVRWSNGNRHRYRFDGGVEGRNEVEVHESSLPRRNSLKSVIGSVGLIVTPVVTGTGFRVGDRYIMTAYHILGNIVEQKTLRKQLQVKFRNETIPKTKESFEIFQLKSEIVYLDETLDIAVLELSENNRPFPPALAFYTNVLNIAQQNILNVLGFNTDGIFTILKCTPLRHDSAPVSKALEYVSENHHRELESYKGVVDSNKIILKCSHWQNGMDGSIGIIEIENEVFVVCLYLKAYVFLFQERPDEEQIRIPDEFVLEQGILISTIKAKVGAIDAELCAKLFSTEVKTIWQMQNGDEGWIDYPVDISEKLELSHTLNRDKTCIITFQGQSIRIMFKTLKARYLSDGSTRTVRRTLKR